ncbi:hypothetical protein NQ318_004980 [Aromia moschata]|uniref:Uncharacterized protein n=1 Tax=Aromia moschata TaxID=1265417 RepID=A0AAV8X7J3_9CUCU|nr:hypothetical protein NQ318_004980 [Aromia moschata]
MCPNKQYYSTIQNCTPTIHPQLCTSKRTEQSLQNKEYFYTNYFSDSIHIFPNRYYFVKIRIKSLKFNIFNFLLYDLTHPANVTKVTKI